MTSSQRIAEYFSKTKNQLNMGWNAISFSSSLWFMVGILLIITFFTIVFYNDKYINGTKSKKSVLLLGFLGLGFILFSFIRFYYDFKQIHESIENSIDVYQEDSAFMPFSAVSVLQNNTAQIPLAKVVADVNKSINSLPIDSVRPAQNVITQALQQNIQQNDARAKQFSASLTRPKRALFNSPVPLNNVQKNNFDNNAFLNFDSAPSQNPFNNSEVNIPPINFRNSVYNSDANVSPINFRNPVYNSDANVAPINFRNPVYKPPTNNILNSSA